VSGQRKALIVANCAYADAALANLPAPAADAIALKDVLGDPRIGGFEVDMASDRPAHDIQRRMDSLFCEARPDDVLLLHFSCHGLKDESGELYFAANDTSPRLLNSTSVPASFVHRLMQRSRAREVVLLLDCCYGGAFPAGAIMRAAAEVDVLESFPQEHPASRRSRVVITASTAMQFAFDGDRLADGGHVVPSVFTAAIVEGLTTGAADQDGDGWVSVQELYDYIFAAVRDRNPCQTPTVSGDLASRLVLARSLRQGDPSAPVPLGRRAMPAGDRASAQEAAGPAPATPSRIRTRRDGDSPPQSQRALVPHSRRRITSRSARGAAIVTTLAGLGALLAWALVAGGRGPNPAGRGPAVHAGAVYAGSSYGFSTPKAVASDGTHIWVANSSGDSVTELNASSGTPLRTISGNSYQFSGPSAITSDGTHVWVADLAGNSLTELNASNGTLARIVSEKTYTTHTPGAIAADGKHVWFASYGGDSVTELNASNGTLVRVISGKSYQFNGPSAITSDGTHVWVASYGGDSVTELNASNGTLVRVISGNGYQFNGPVAITSDAAHIWVANWVGGSVTELNASDGTLVRTISGNGYQFSEPGAIVSDAAHIWVTGFGDDSVTELNASNGAIVRTISGNGYQFNGPSAITSDGTHVWVTNSGGNSVTEFSEPK
jgi:DNA-binding beta-propeller fold protein YncE